MFMLRTIRKSRGLTMKELGEKVGKSEASIGLYETEQRKPDYEVLLRLSEALDCSVDSILGNNYALTNDEEQLLYFFRQLNDIGKRQLLKQAVLLATDEHFQNSDPTIMKYVLKPIATAEIA